jgi:hypothetical protein
VTSKRKRNVLLERHVSAQAHEELRENSCCYKGGRKNSHARTWGKLAHAGGVHA